MRFKFIYSTTTALVVLCTLVGAAKAGQLFPPNNIGSNPNVSCPNGELLTWHGDRVDCENPTPGVSVSCPAGQVLNGIANGAPVCIGALDYYEVGSGRLEQRKNGEVTTTIPLTSDARFVEISATTEVLGSNATSTTEFYFTGTNSVFSTPLVAATIEGNSNNDSNGTPRDVLWPVPKGATALVLVALMDQFYEAGASNPTGDGAFITATILGVK
jgi:hypothetical protein